MSENFKNGKFNLLKRCAKKDKCKNDDFVKKVLTAFLRTVAYIYMRLKN